ncbi:ATP-binding cassette domain-containing protein [Enterococcus sp. BWM-S5]|uniref:ATP-binding cassette domain-containing protein n=1 Tax=Enterococcus larvae TaxID=2794352 RepID=A0ABS4CKW5_9ENTE|nr:ATP-binding cassette domain-containing protein [Enterococcus larvae]MBP1047235.1 ATP-binding cassette domain-containing protein [Enterococcus larvae]
MYTHNMQNSINDCGIAAVLTVLDQLKINREDFHRTYNKSKKETMQGLSVKHIIDIFLEYGVNTDGYIVDEFEELKSQQFPIIAMIEQEGLPHYVVLHDITEDCITLSNPSEHEVQRITIDEFKKNFSNRVVCIEKIDVVDKSTSYSESLYQTVIGNIAVKNKLWIAFLTLGKLAIPLLAVIGLEYVLSNKVGQLTSNRMLSLLLAYVPIIMLFSYANTKTAEMRVRLTNKLQKEIMTKYYLSELEDVSFNKNVSQITGYFWNILTAISGLLQLFYLKVDLLYGAILLIGLAIISPYCVLIVMFWGALFLWIAKRNAVDIKNLYSSTLTNSNGLASVFEENVNASCDITTFNKQEEAYDFFQKKISTFFQSNVLLVEKETRMNTLLEVFNIIVLLNYFLVFFYFFKTGSIDQLEKLGSGLLLLYLVATNFKPIYSNWITYQKSKNAIFVIESEQQTFIQPSARNEIIGLKEIEKLTIEGLTFSYDETKIFSKANIHFEKGKIYGIRGDNGSGKSTLINIILGLIKPEIAVTKINGKRIDTLFNSSIIDHISYYSTEMNIFQNTVENNINFSVFDEAYKETEERDRLSLNLVDEYIVTGGGNNISVGQRQKILLMRTLMRKKEIYIFDEPTGNLDSEATKEFMQIVQSLSDKIIIIVTHQTRLLDCCDVIYDIKAGGIYE